MNSSIHLHPLAKEECVTSVVSVVMFGGLDPADGIEEAEIMNIPYVVLNAGLVNGREDVTTVR